MVRLLVCYIHPFPHCAGSKTTLSSASLPFTKIDEDIDDRNDDALNAIDCVTRNRSQSLPSVEFQRLLCNDNEEKREDNERTATAPESDHEDEQEKKRTVSVGSEIEDSETTATDQSNASDSEGSTTSRGKVIVIVLFSFVNHELVR